MKRTLALCLALILLVSLSGCLDEASRRDTNMTLALVVAGNFEDGDVYDAALAGAKRLESEGLELFTVECGGQDLDDKLWDAASKAELVVLVGPGFTEVSDICHKYYETKFFWIESEATKQQENLMNLIFAGNEVGYLAGYLGAKLSQGLVPNQWFSLGFLGSSATPFNLDYIAGYTQAVVGIDRDYSVSTLYSDRHNSHIGMECALTLNEKSAQVITMHTDPTSATGAMEMAARLNMLVIWMDTDLARVSHPIVPFVIQRRVGEAIYREVGTYLDAPESYKKFGTTQVADLESGLIDLVYGDNELVLEALKTELAALRQEIIDGELAVNSTR